MQNVLQNASLWERVSLIMEESVSWGGGGTFVPSLSSSISGDPLVSRSVGRSATQAVISPYISQIGHANTDPEKL